MAGDWIKFETATPDKPEIWLIAEAVGIDPDAVVGKLLRIWIWFDQHTENANAPSVSKLTLNRLVGVSDFCEHVIAAGWMGEKNGEISLPNFDRHNGKTAKNRALTAKRVAKHTANAKLTLDALAKEEKRRVKKDVPNGTSKKVRKRTVFQKPMVDEVATYCTERGNNVSPQAFCDYYESVNWHVGKKRMADWRAAVRTWEKRNAASQKPDSKGYRTKTEQFFDACREYANSDADDLDSDPVCKTAGEIRPQVVEFIPRRIGKGGDD